MRNPFHRLKISRFITPPIQIRYAADFVVTHFATESVDSYFSRPEFTDYMKKVGEMDWREATLKYRAITDEDLMPGAIAATIARHLALSESEK